MKPKNILRAGIRHCKMKPPFEKALAQGVKAVWSAVFLAIGRKRFPKAVQKCGKGEDGTWNIK
ncbi:hypothetical protein ABD75_06200 [Bacillus vallismortis]|nr:hypothetical protein [Bacillus vallismortis]